MIEQRPMSGLRVGFTLIEVLMAAFIIALGVLGLSALFAGAARQQQAASQTTNAVVVSNNAEAIVARNFGTIDGPGFAGGTPPAEGVWFPVPTPDSANGQNLSQDNFLSIDAADDGDNDGSLYFLVDEPQTTVLLEAVQRQSLDTVYRLETNQLNNPGSMPQGMSPARTLAHGRIDPASTTEIRVVLGPTRDNAGVRERVLTMSYVHGSEVSAQLSSGEIPPPINPIDQSNAISDWGSLPNNPDDPTTQNDDERFITFFPGGAVNYSNYIILDIGLTPGASSGSALYQNPEAGRLRVVNIGLARDEIDLQILRIEMGAYKWRNDRLISLEDRIVSKEDSSSSTGRRPDIGYALLYRRFTTGASQLGVFTYQLTPVDGQGLRPTTPVRPGEPLFVPKERFSDIINADAPIALVEDVELAYDDLDKVYYISVDADDADARWVAEPGQLLVVAERNAPSQLTNRRTGSDLPVRVLRKSTLANGRLRADLDRVPRAEGESMLPDLNQTENVSVWAVQETVKSRRGNATWKLSPLDFRVIQVR